jgi:hypothetical protein
MNRPNHRVGEKTMSSYLRLVSGLSVAALAPLAGCVDPAGKFDEFENRVIDARPGGGNGGGAIHDVTGEFLLGLRPAFSPGDVIQFLVTSSLTETAGGATLDLAIQPLTAEKCTGNGGQPVGDELEETGIDVNTTGEFTVVFTKARVDSQANDVSCSIIEADVGLTGVLRSADLFCGQVAGEVFRPAGVPPLDGSTFAAIRVAPGTLGGDLPEPMVECPSAGDAGP